MKNRTPKYLFFTLLFIYIVMACKETIIEYIEKDCQHGYVSLSTSEIEIGQKITAHFNNMDSVHVWNVTLNERQVTFSQKNDSTVTLIAPYNIGGNIPGNFVLYSWMRTRGSNDTVLVSNQIHYLYENAPLGPYIKWNTNERIEESEAWEIGSIGEIHDWLCTISGDTVKLTRQNECHDECSNKNTLVFITNGNDTLPELLYAQYERNEWMVEPINEIITQRCKVIIDTWNEETVFSGTFTSNNHSWVFWYSR